MRLIKIFCILVIFSISFIGCEKILDPVDDNHHTIERVYELPAYAEGLLMTAYVRLPTNSFTFNEVATDDAVTNNKSDQYLRMATGEWTDLYNPVGQWDNALIAISYINQFLNMVDDIEWKPSDAEVHEMFVRRLKGEAYGLRGLFGYYLLQTVGGVGTNGTLLGMPILTNFVKVDANYTMTRAGFTESVTQIYSDLNKALEYLTMDDYKNITSKSQLPPGLENVTDVAKYNLVFGLIDNQRISGRIIKAIRARVALLAASPAFSTGNLTLWETAANYAAGSIVGNGGLTSLDPQGHRYYEGAIIDAINLAGGAETKEMAWRRAKNNNRTRETNNFPPSLFGNGNVNPTQNLVDAFPMANGYPITHASSGYNPSTPYTGRDPRLARYIVYNGNTLAGKVIKTAVGGGNNAKDSLSNSTRTGYYLKKLLREDVVVDPVSATSKMHYEVAMRWTEIFLIYAEAANEAWGPTGRGPNTFSAYDVIAAIRKRAGITQPDNYLNSITSKDEMRNLIRNERRIELSFEGFRFWDLRRWKVDLTETAKGVNINKAGTTYSVVDVEARKYNNNYMHYGPVPQKEKLKYSTLIQNQGW